MSIVIETTIGDITVDLYIQERPRACLNFLKLCKIKYYNWCLFHKIERDFIAQSGDPTGTGKGGNSIFYTLFGEQARFFEFEQKPRIKHLKLGALSMVNNGENLHGSQFFITLAESLDYLDQQTHTVFGEVVGGFEVLTKLNETICDEESKPYQDIRITHTVIIDDPFPDPERLEIPDMSPDVTDEVLNSSRIGVLDDIDGNEGKTAEEIEEEIKDKEAKARATILEMVGDIPNADIAPPENVLFVCKLNPVTKEDDLEVIFSRFGAIVSCEVIRDHKSGESLQYAFIEFENKEDCEKAYFKMDNVLIDDRRIHVDFSQSVSKIKWKGKGRGVEYFEDVGSDKTEKPTFVIKKGALGQRLDNKYDYVEDSSGEFEGAKRRDVRESHRSHKSHRSRSREPHRTTKSEREESYSRHSRHSEHKRRRSPSERNRRDERARHRRRSRSRSRSSSSSRKHRRDHYRDYRR